MVVATATAREVDANLTSLLSDVPPDESGAVRVSPQDLVTWTFFGSEVHSVDAGADAVPRQQVWEDALAGVGLPIPITVGELADVLAVLGVLRRTGTGAGGATERWRSPEVLPLVADLLPVPVEWADARAEVGRRQQGQQAAQRLIRHLLDAGRPALIRTTVTELADATGLSDPMVRRGLATLHEDGEFRLSIAGRAPALGACSDLPFPDDRAEFELAVDWSAFDRLRIRIAPIGQE
jgi:hypothetical protein